jgi:hypothetical protein
LRGESPSNGELRASRADPEPAGPLGCDERPEVFGFAGRASRWLRSLSEPNGAPQPDEYSEFLGADWEPVGDGTYRYVGHPSPAAWQDDRLPSEPLDTELHTRVSRAMELTAVHRTVLRTIGSKGATRDELGPFATSLAMVELMAAGYVTRETTDATGLPDAWYLTPAGATAIGVNTHHANGV